MSTRGRLNCRNHFIVPTRSGFSCVVLIIFSAMVAAPVHGQSFLEKLESAVRERLNDAATTRSPKPVTPARSSGEELPPPSNKNSDNGQSQPGPRLLEMTQSVLEAPPEATVPATGPVPPPVVDNAVVENVVAAAPAEDRGIYLGLEAEEITGGGIGVKVSNVTASSPAWKAGFKPGDRIMAVGGFAIASLESMVEQLGKAVPGESVKFLVSRDGRNIELVAVLMEAGLAERIAGTALPIGQLNMPQAAAGTPWLGVLVTDLSPAFRNQFGLTVFRGAAITTVATGSPAARIGMMAGDAITSIDGVPIETARQVMSWLETARPGQTIDITYQRGSVTRTAKLTLEISPTSRAQRSVGRGGATATGASPPPRPQPTDSSEQTDTAVNPAPRANVAQTSGTIPNTIPAPSPVESNSSQVDELQREVAALRAQLEEANRRLQTTQDRLQQILEGLGNN